MTIKEAENLFKGVTLDMLGGSPPADVRISWPTQGAPAFGINQDVIFLRVIEQDGQYNRQKEREYTNIDADTKNQALLYTRILNVTWIFYGPNSFDNAQTVRDKIFYQQHHDTLAKQQVYLITDFQAPRRAPDLFQGDWWERVDLSISFNEQIIRNEIISTVLSAEIGIESDSGLKKELIITE